jgi:hypothetical protein
MKQILMRLLQKCCKTQKTSWHFHDGSESFLAIDSAYPHISVKKPEGVPEKINKYSQKVDLKE